MSLQEYSTKNCRGSNDKAACILMDFHRQIGPNIERISKRSEQKRQAATKLVVDRASEECCESEGGIQGRVSICTSLFYGKPRVGATKPLGHRLTCESTWPPAPRPSKLWVTRLSREEKMGHTI